MTTTKRRLGVRGPEAIPIGLGCMGMSDGSMPSKFTENDMRQSMPNV